MDKIEGRSNAVLVSKPIYIRHIYHIYYIESLERRWCMHFIDPSLQYVFSLKWQWVVYLCSWLKRSMVDGWKNCIIFLLFVWIIKLTGGFQLSFSLISSWARIIIRSPFDFIHKIGITCNSLILLYVEFNFATYILEVLTDLVGSPRCRKQNLQVETSN